MKLHFRFELLQLLETTQVTSARCSYSSTSATSVTSATWSYLKTCHLYDSLMKITCHTRIWRSHAIHGYYEYHVPTHEYKLSRASHGCIKITYHSRMWTSHAFDSYNTGYIHILQCTHTMFHVPRHTHNEACVCTGIYNSLPQQPPACVSII